MFDMGFTEMMLIGIVALIVIGPERLPGVARTAGKYFGRLKRFVSTVKADVEQELRADELREILAKQQQELDSLKSTISDAGREIEQEGADLVQQLDPTADTDNDEVSHADGALTDNDETLAAAEADAAAKVAAAEAEAAARLEADAESEADVDEVEDEPARQSAGEARS